MNEVKLLNIGGIDQNIKDQYVRDVIAPSENGLDSSTNLPVSSRHYDEGEYLIGQDRQYYIAITDIEVGDTLVVGTNIRRTTVSEEIIALKNQSADVVLEVIADVETDATASKAYAVDSYFYWNYGLNAGMYKVIADIATSDALVVDTNIEAADKIMNIISGIESKIDTIKYSNPNLLDNPWFTVNQRGLSNYGYDTGWTVDRWKNQVGNRGGITNVDSDGITFTCIASGTGNPFLRQQTEINVKKHIGIGQKITVSIKMKNGDIATGTGVIENVPYTENFIAKAVYNIMNDNTLMGTLNATIFENVDGLLFFNLRIDRASGINVDFEVDIRAVKVEVGSISTLANDTAPNYQQELAKCQRYCVVYSAANENSTIAIGQFVASRFYAILNTPTAMRIKPVVTFTNNGLSVYAEDTSYPIDAYSSSGTRYTSNISKLRFEFSSQTQQLIPANGNFGELQLSNGSQLILSADL